MIANSATQTHILIPAHFTWFYTLLYILNQAFKEGRHFEGKEVCALINDWVLNGYHTAQQILP